MLYDFLEEYLKKYNIEIVVELLSHDIIRTMKKPRYLDSFIKYPPDTSFEGRDEDERVVFLIRQSRLTLFWWVVATIILLIIPLFLMPYLAKLEYNGNFIFNGLFILSLNIFWYVTVFGFAFRHFLDWYFEVLLVTNKRIIDIDRGATVISEAPLSNIQDVTSKITSIVGQVFNIGSIVVQTASEQNNFEFHTVDNPSVLRDTISDIITKRQGDKYANA
jgi:membrane protein YdbS with pleckstrin-like domain